MEASVFVVDAFALVVMVVMVLRDARRKPGDPEINPFRYVERLPRADGAADGVLDRAAARRWRRR